MVWLDVPVAVMSPKNFALLQCSRLRRRIKLKMLRKGRFRRKHSKPLKPAHPATLTRCPTFGQRVFLCRPYTCPPHKSPASPPLQRTPRQPARVCVIEITTRRYSGAASLTSQASMTHRTPACAVSRGTQPPGSYATRKRRRRMKSKQSGIKASVPVCGNDASGLHSRFSSGPEIAAHISVCMDRQLPSKDSTNHGKNPRSRNSWMFPGALASTRSVA